MENIIEIKDYCKKLKGSEVLKHINLTFTGGNVYGLKGKNGSGKTMLMRAICGLISPTSGSVVINGETLGKQISFPRSVGVLIENPAFIPGYTGLKNLEVLADIQKKIDRKKICETLEKIGLDSQGYSCHKLRHTAATLMYQQGGVDVRVLKEVLGHENLGTTEIYTHLSSEQMKNAADSNPLAKIKPKKKV